VRLLGGDSAVRDYEAGEIACFFCRRGRYVPLDPARCPALSGPGPYQCNAKPWRGHRYCYQHQRKAAAPSSGAGGGE
jgi:hypothetical protein